MSCKTYPLRSTKAEKAVIKKYAKHFKLVAGPGVLHYKLDKAKSGGGVFAIALAVEIGARAQ